MALTPRGGWRAGWAGRVLDDTRVRVAPDGELLVRSPGLMLGYHRRPVGHPGLPHR